MFRIDDLKIQISYTDDSTDIICASQVDEMNGFETKNGMAFIDRDPYMFIAVSPEKQIRNIQITGDASFASCEDMEDLVAVARRVPDYESLYKQLSRMREKQKPHEEEYWQ